MNHSLNFFEAFHWPAEWEHQARLWVTWPQNELTWKPVWENVRNCYVNIIREVSRFQPIVILVDQPLPESDIVRIFDSLPQLQQQKISFQVYPTNDSWIRDYGAFSVYTGDRREFRKKLMLNFRFNSWGGKYPPWEKDDATPEFMAKYTGCKSLSVPMVLEGGSVDGNGEGLLLTTKQCLLNSNRNPEKNQSQIEQLLDKYLGAHKILWLDKGIKGDDTDGHIDDIARFVNSKTVFHCIEHQKSDPNYEPLRKNAELLAQYGKNHNLNLVEIPMPDIVEVAGIRTPASYVNFTIINNAVLVPRFGFKNEDNIFGLFAEHFPGREVVPIASKYLVYGQGAIHCSTMQEPS